MRLAQANKLHVSEASCPNFEPRAHAHARLTGLTSPNQVLTCQTSKTRMCARLEIRTGRFAHTYVASRRARAVRAKCSLAGLTRCLLVKPVRRACARGSKFGQDASLSRSHTYVASRRARAVRAKCSLAARWTEVEK